MEEKSLSWETNSCFPTPEIHGIVQTRKVHYRVQKSQAHVPMMSQMNPIQSASFCF
jgi:hypothetical protein